MRHQGKDIAPRCLGRLLNTIDKGYSVVITMPKKMSLVRNIAITCLLDSNLTRHTSFQEKEALLRALGAQVIRTPDEEPWDSPRSHIGRAHYRSMVLLVAEFLNDRRCGTETSARNRTWHHFGPVSQCKLHSTNQSFY